MFSLLSRQLFAPSRSRSTQPTPKLRLEFLEGRDQPSTLDGTSTPDTTSPPTTDTTTASTATTVNSTGPVITEFLVQETAVGILISGHVDVADPAGMFVTIDSGYDIMNNIIVTLDASGDFAVAIILDAGVRMSGSAVANCTDWNGNCAQPVYATFVISS